MTRSFGDKVAASVGITADPEIEVRAGFGLLVLAIALINGFYGFISSFCLLSFPFFHLLWTSVSHD